ncbi:type II secretion system protein N [Thalassotalea sediminis]|uniref:type II secretion system protein N n=1 Tax=Thalassotalea sediminis TaxID=1759089 RepID=UPI0025727222|nr:type II secretion system protein N [Thalassotalea sediminis]
MKKWFVFAACFISVYLGFLLVNLPAAYVASWVSLPKNISAVGIGGSLWRPTIERVVVNGQHIEKVHAEVSIFSLLSLNPKITARFGDPALTPIDGRVTVNNLLSAPVLSETVINLPAALIAKQISTPVAITAHRYISISLSSFQVGTPICQQLAGKAFWKNAGVTVMDQKIPLGDLSGQLSCQAGEAVLSIDSNNDIGLTFTVNVGANGYAYGQGYILPTSKTPQAIMQVLPMVTKKDAQGRYPLRF